MSPVRALSVAALVVVAASIAVAGPGLAGAGNHSAANAPTETPANATPGGGTDATDGTNGTMPAGGNSTEDGNPSGVGNTSTNGNTTARGQAIEPGPVQRPNPRPRGPRIVPDVVVDDDGKAHYRTLSAAVEDARENDTILVRPGTYDGPVSVDVDGLTIAGFGPEATELAGAGTGTAVVVSASDVTVQSVGVRGYRSGVAVEAGDGEVTEDVELTNVTVERVSGAGVRIETDGSAATVSNVTVESSELRLGGEVGWSGENASSGGSSSKAGWNGNSSKAGERGNESATANSTAGRASSAGDGPEAGNGGNGSAAGIPVDDGPVTGVAIESPAGSVADVHVVDTSVTDLGTGMRVAGTGGSIVGVRVVGSEFGGNDRGIDVADGAVRSLDVEGTDFVENDVGLVVREPVDPSALSLRENRFADNDVGLWSRAAGPLDAEGNDWGAPSGPDAPGNPTGQGDAVRGPVDVDPWLPPVLRLENAAVSSGRLTVDLVAHAEGVAGYEVVVASDPGSVDDVAVEGGAMPASLEVDGDALVVSGSASSPVAGPAVLATVAFEGDPAAVDALELRGDRSAAYDGDGRALDAAFLAGDLSVDVDDGEESPNEAPATATPSGTPTEAPTTATPTGGPPTSNDTARARPEAPPRTSVTGTPTAAGETPADGGGRAVTETPVGGTDRPTDAPDSLDLQSLQRRLYAVGDALSTLGDLLRTLVGGSAAR